MVIVESPCLLLLVQIYVLSVFTNVPLPLYASNMSIGHSEGEYILRYLLSQF